MPKMVFHNPKYWWQGATPTPTVNATLTKIATTTATLLNVNAPQLRRWSRSLKEEPLHYWITEVIHLILLLSIPILWWIARGGKGESEEDDDEQDEESWQAPWQTTEWKVLYGLIAMAHDNDWPYTPFRQHYNSSIRERWNRPNKHGLKRLLQKGIIPLFVQDGGVSTQQRASWGWSTAFPYLKTPLFRQTKNRAYFEFLVPYPELGDAKTFMHKLVYNTQGYGITLRFSSPPPDGSIFYAEMNPPCVEELDQHFSVGAESALEMLLPFKQDGVFEKAQGGRARQLRWFIKGLDSRRVPLLHHAEWVLVRVESQDWSALELDERVWAIAQEVMPGTPWPEEVVRKAARTELVQCGFDVQDA